MNVDPSKQLINVSIIHRLQILPNVLNVRPDTSFNLTLNVLKEQFQLLSIVPLKNSQTLVNVLMDISMSMFQEDSNVNLNPLIVSPLLINNLVYFAIILNHLEKVSFKMEQIFSFVKQEVLQIVFNIKPKSKCVCNVMKLPI